MKNKFKKFSKTFSILEKQKKEVLKKTYALYMHDEMSCSFLKEEEKKVFGEDVFLKQAYLQALRSKDIAEKEKDQAHHAFLESKKTSKQFEFLEKKEDQKKHIIQQRVYKSELDMWVSSFWRRK